MFLFASISAGNFTNTVVFGKTNETFENTENTTEIINNEKKILKKGILFSLKLIFFKLSLKLYLSKPFKA